VARPFPVRQRVALLACALTIGLIASITQPVLADEDDKRDELTDRKSDLNHDLKHAKGDLHEVSRELVLATGALRRAQARLGVAQRRLAVTRGELTAARNLDEQTQEALDDAEQRLEDAETAVRETGERMERLRDDMGDFVADSYRYGSPGLVSLGIVINGGDPNQLGENLALADSVVGAQSATLDELAASETLLEVEQERVSEIRDEVARKRDAAAENLERRRELAAEAREQAAEVREIVTVRKGAQQRAAAAKRTELKRIERLEASRERVKDMLRRLARTRQPGPSVSAPSSGYLSWPVQNTYITSPYGMRMHPILHVYKLHDGTDFGVPCGTPVYAAAGGKVVSAYYDAAYGNRVILANGTVNGSSLSTSYNHLTSDRVSVGSYVHRGDLIGYSGTTGYSTGCHLHFMVYVNGVTADPMDWLS
jgi:murein DD-endopeptidase MepM/ murein hydrolase activator NlpD